MIETLTRASLLLGDESDWRVLFVAEQVARFCVRLVAGSLTAVEARAGIA
jgi:hypothetical protein